MSTAQGKKHKTGIPVARPSSKDGRGDEENSDSAVTVGVLSARSQSQASQGSGTKLHGRKPEQPPQPQTSSHHPLAKAMAKKPNAKKNQSSETWFDEEIESHSQKMKMYSHSEQRKRREDMEKQLREAESQLVTMSDLLEKREKLMKEAQDEAEKTTSELEQKLLDQDGKLIQNGIDPVTGEKIVMDEEGQKKVESAKKFTKKRVQEMKEKLRQMNNRTESYLADIENTMQYLDSLEAASTRAGPLSEETQKMFDQMGSEENIIAQVYGENRQPTTTGKPASAPSSERLAPSGKNTPDVEEEGDENDNKGSQFFLTRMEEDSEKKNGDEEDKDDDNDNNAPQNDVS